MNRQYSLKNLEANKDLGQWLLGVAGEVGQPELVEWLLHHGAQPTTSQLMFALENGMDGLVQEFPVLVQQHGKAIINFALENKRPDLVRMVLANSEKPTAAQLMFAFENGFEDLAPEFQHLVQPTVKIAPDFSVDHEKSSPKRRWEAEIATEFDADVDVGDGDGEVAHRSKRHRQRAVKSEGGVSSPAVKS